MFARYWFAALDWGYATTDSTLAKTLYLPSCLDCARFMRNFDVPKSKGEHFKGGRVRIEATSVVFGDHRHAGTTPIDVTISVGMLKTLTATGKVAARAPPIQHVTYRLWLRWTPGLWKVRDTKQVVRK